MPPTLEERVKTLEDGLKLAAARLTGLREMVMTLEDNFRAFRQKQETEKAEAIRREAIEAQAQENAKRKRRRT